MIRNPVNRRDFLAAALAASPLASLASAVEPAPPKVGAAVTAYYHNSHADVIVGKILEGYNLDHKPPRPNLDLAGLYVEQFPKNDKSREVAKQHKYRDCKTIEDAVTLGTGKLAVDGVILVAEHGEYPTNDRGQILYPRRRFMEEVVKVFRKSGRSVPVFSDKHLATNWADAKWMYDQSRELGFPLMAGSSIPLTWRKPAIEPPRGFKPTEVLAISYHLLDTYGFHAMEVVQCLAERRGEGETGIAAVQCLDGPAVWKAGEQGRFDRKLLDAALGVCERKLKKPVEVLAKTPTAFLMEYRDGFRASVLTLDGPVLEWAAAWREGTGEPAATVFWSHEARPLGHFTFLVQGIEHLIRKGKSPWPVERTLLTTGTLAALFESRAKGGVRIETPHLAIAYKPTFDWTDPPPPPPSRPFTGP